MVYVGKKGGDASEDDMRLPSQYSGNAFDADGQRRLYVPDEDALRHAEELFRRGYVFERTDLHSGAGDDGIRFHDTRAAAAVAEADAQPDMPAASAASTVAATAAPAATAAYPDLGQSARENAFRETEAATSDDRPFAPEKREPEVSAVGTRVERRAPGLLGRIGEVFGKISTEDILLGAIILMLLMNGSDDELLIMLVILLFC